MQTTNKKETTYNYMNYLDSIVNQLYEVNKLIDTDIKNFDKSDIESICKYCDNIVDICALLRDRVKLYEDFYNTFITIRNQMINN